MQFLLFGFCSHSRLCQDAVRSLWWFIYQRVDIEMQALCDLLGGLYEDPQLRKRRRHMNAFRSASSESCVHGHVTIDDILNGVTEQHLLRPDVKWRLTMIFIWDMIWGRMQPSVRFWLFSAILSQCLHIRPCNSPGSELSDIINNRYGFIDYEYGIASASTDFVSTRTVASRVSIIWWQRMGFARQGAVTYGKFIFELFLSVK